MGPRRDAPAADGAAATRASGRIGCTSCIDFWFGHECQFDSGCDLVGTSHLNSTNQCVCKDGYYGERPALLAGRKTMFLDARNVMNLNRGSGVSVVWPRESKGTERYKGHR